MIQPKNETEDLLLSLTKNCEKLIEQIHRKAEEVLEFRQIKSREMFHSYPPIQTKGDCLLGLIVLEVYSSIFNINTTNDRYELYTDTFDELSFDKKKDELEEILEISNITDENLQDEITGPRIIEIYWKLRSEKSSTDVYIILLRGYASSPFPDFESYLRIIINLDEVDIQSILKQYNANFVIFEIDPGIYIIKDLHEAVHPLGDHEGTLQIEYDDLNNKVKLILTRFGSTFGTLRFDEKSFFHTLLKFEPYSDYKPTNALHAVSLGVYTIEKNLNLNTINIIHLKCDVIEGSIQDGVRQPTLFSFVSEKQTGYSLL